MKKSLTLALAAAALGGGALVHSARADRAQSQRTDFEGVFRAGDQVPVVMSAGGELFEMTNATPHTLVAKRTFWLRARQNELEVSFDGTNYRPLSEVVGGTLSLSSGAEGPLGVDLQTHLK